MADVIITYLNYGVFDSQLSTAVVPKVPSGAAPSLILRSKDVPSRIRSLVLKLLQSRRHTDFDMGKTLADASRYLRSSPDQFPFHSYAKAHLLQHVIFISEQDSRTHNLLLKLLKRKFIGDVGSEESQTLLFWASRTGHKAVIQLLIAPDKVDIDVKDQFGRTPLSWAVESGDEAIVQQLLGRGAEIEAKDNDGRSPLSRVAGNGYETAENKHPAVVQLLLDWGAEIEAKDNDGQTLLLWAARNGHAAIVQLLLDRGVEIEAKDNNGRTPLFWAIKNKYTAVVRLLK